MISIENLYFILYANLLQHSGLDCFYYYPFGTTERLSHSSEFQQWQPKHEHHALFGFDQEPLQDQGLGDPYDIIWFYWTSKNCKLLANSEHSLIKKQICRERNMLDWYYFYHGLAALDWFRDARYLATDHRPSKVFCSYNHIVKHKRSYRMAMTAKLLRAGLANQGDISFHGTVDDCARELLDANSELDHVDKSLIDAVLVRGGVTLPMLVDHATIDASFSARFGHQEYQLWQRAFLHLVNETVFYDDKLHLTEKVFKPIVALRPFILVAAPGNLSYLKRYGFRTFEPWIDESYDQEPDHTARLQMIVDQVQRLCALSSSQLQDMHSDMQDTLRFNKQHFFGNFLDSVVDELVDNFDACIRVWNNGRLDPDRILNRNRDIETVKNILKGRVIAGI